ncbi:MAG: Rrf2 family transcriptional regulator [Epsilonproteobacteria bacterium]|nr:MAG: Rrf2 family transcriptional regulator [Campylobacterota bacterium]
MIGISSKTIYAVAALQELSKFPDNEVRKIKDIASSANIPQNFLEQILLELKKQGILSSVKGANGGYKLVKNLQDISLKDILLILESDILSINHETENIGLNLFWEDLREKVSEIFEIPLSELRNYQLQATQTLNFSI